MDVYNFANACAQELMQHIVNNYTNVHWQPTSTPSRNESLSCLSAKFKEKIARVVAYFYNHYLTNFEEPPQAFPTFQDFDVYLFHKFFTDGFSVYNLLEYCGQLATYAFYAFSRRGVAALDSCASSMAGTICDFVNLNKMTLTFFIELLVEEVEGIRLPVASPLYKSFLPGVQFRQASSCW